MKRASRVERQHEMQRETRLRARRTHKKSRNGCLECKRRKVKCDEAKPSCRRCASGLQKCFYQSASPATDPRKSEHIKPSFAISDLSPRYSLESDLYSSSKSIICSATTVSELEADHSQFILRLSDTDLYHHYLSHVSRTLNHSPRDQGVFQIGMPTLALRSNAVFHAILALSATNICCSMIKNSVPEPSKVSSALTIAYQHYNMASEQMRGMLLQAEILEPEHLLASNILLVPFAAASQQVHHWVASRSKSKDLRKYLSSTPRDVIVIMRGVRTMIKMLADDTQNSSVKSDLMTGLAAKDSWLSQLNTFPPSFSSPSRTHKMFPILAETYGKAFSDLESRLRHTSLLFRDSSGVSACSAAFTYLKRVAMSTFETSKMSISASPVNEADGYLNFPSFPDVTLPGVSNWLGNYANRHQFPQSQEPLARFFLTFLVQTPQEYLDLLLPLLDQRLEVCTEDALPEVTLEQAIALDIYAHWSVLMLLAENECWWIGSLPVVTLSGMLNGFGDDFVERLWAEYDKKEWWPGAMLRIRRGIQV